MSCPRFEVLIPELQWFIFYDLSPPNLMAVGLTSRLLCERMRQFKQIPLWKTRYYCRWRFDFTPIHLKTEFLFRSLLSKPMWPVPPVRALSVATTDIFFDHHYIDSIGKSSSVSKNLEMLLQVRKCVAQKEKEYGSNAFKLRYLNPHTWFVTSFNLQTLSFMVFDETGKKFHWLTYALANAQILSTGASPKHNLVVLTAIRFTTGCRETHVVVIPDYNQTACTYRIYNFDIVAMKKTILDLKQAFYMKESKNVLYEYHKDIEQGTFQPCFELKLDSKVNEELTFGDLSSLKRNPDNICVACWLTVGNFTSSTITSYMLYYYNCKTKILQKKALPLEITPIAQSLQLIHLDNILYLKLACEVSSTEYFWNLDLEDLLQVEFLSLPPFVVSASYPISGHYMTFDHDRNIFMDSFSLDTYLIFKSKQGYAFIHDETRRFDYPIIYAIDESPLAPRFLIFDTIDHLSKFEEFPHKVESIQNKG